MYAQGFWAKSQLPLQSFCARLPRTDSHRKKERESREDGFRGLARDLRRVQHRAVGEDRTDAHSVGRDKGRLTIAEAAALLGVHKNTVRNRIKNGSYRAEMVQTERGPTYLIERSSLLTNSTTNTLSSASQDVVSPQAMEFVQELLRPFVSELGEVREELGTERARRQMAEERAAALEAELEVLREERESPETVEETPDRAEPRPATGGAQEPLEPFEGRGSGTGRGSLWRRIFGR